MWDVAKEVSFVDFRVRALFMLSFCFFSVHLLLWSNSVDGWHALMTFYFAHWR